MSEETYIVHVIMHIRCPCGHEFDATFMEIYPKTTGRMVNVKCPKCYMIVPTWLYP